MSRRERYARLLQLRNQVQADIARIEAEMRAEEPVKAPPRPERKIAQCGTDGGYYRHRRRLNEPACDDCRRAHNAYEAERARRSTAARKVAA